MPKRGGRIAHFTAILKARTITHPSGTHEITRGAVPLQIRVCTFVLKPIFYEGYFTQQNFY
jgi:hypothetical protein